ncbi:MAG: hypothetical protein NVS9B4_23880 [Candidatus Acidiferrum sp.]
MSTEHNQSGHSAQRLDLGPRHEDVAFESRDVKARTIYWYLLALAVAVAASFAVCVTILRVTTRMAEDGDTPPPASRAMLGPQYHNMPPEPRLQGVPGHESDPQQDMRDKLKADSDANEGTAWMDRSAGMAQIPVKEAMKIIAEKGLPAMGGTATAPAGKNAETNEAKASDKKAKKE